MFSRRILRQLLIFKRVVLLRVLTKFSQIFTGHSYRRQFQNCVRLFSNFEYFNNKEQFTQTIQKYIAVVKEIAISAE
jgi:hypothetical protein